jgi:hypothetical protein
MMLAVFFAPRGFGLDSRVCSHDGVLLDDIVSALSKKVDAISDEQQRRVRVGWDMM